MEKVVNIALDLETLSKRTTAAIIGIAAKVFCLGENKAEDASFFQSVDETSCAMCGFDIDPQTVDWWSRKPDEVKKQFDGTVPIKDALDSLVSFINDVKTVNKAERVMIWCQGTDFDISILRNAFVVVNNDRAEKTIPWKYVDVRDSRTFIHEGVRLIYHGAEDPYSVIPKMDNWNAHDAMSDVEVLIHNVSWVNEKLSNFINHV